MRGYANPKITYHGCFFYQFDFLRETLVHPFLVGSIEEDYSKENVSQLCHVLSEGRRKPFEQM